MAKKQKSKAPKAAKAAKAAKVAKASKGSGKVRVASNVYTGMTFIAMAMLITALTFVLMRSNELFGGIDKLFSLEESRETPRMAAPVSDSTPQPAAEPTENQ